MTLVAQAFHLRWIEWALGAILLLAVLGRYFSPTFKSATEMRLSHLEIWVEKNFKWPLGILCFCFFALATFAKSLQLSSFSLNAQDFWLFEDLLRQMVRGAPFLTRFAPQALGWVQHGPIHGTYTWFLVWPFVWCSGSQATALLYGPLCFASAGFVLGCLARPKLRALGALVLTLAFLGSSQVGRVLMYEVHNESAYPFFVFLWAWAMGLGGGPVRWFWLFFATFWGVGIKLDSAFVFFPWMVWGIFFLKGRQKKAAFFSLLLGVFSYGGMLFCSHEWSTGVWGPKVWEGFPVTITASNAVFHGGHWETPEGVWQVVSQSMKDVGGVSGFLISFLRFIFSRPFLSLVVLGPWMILSARVLWSLAPLSAVYSVLGSPSKLWNYYSAPFLGSVWIGILSLPKRSWLVWVLGASLLLGGEGLVFNRPSEVAVEIRAEAKKDQACFDLIRGQGMVPGIFLGLVSRDKIWTDRVPATGDQWARTRFFYFVPTIGAWGFSEAQAQELYQRLSRDPEWERWNSNCKPVGIESQGSSPLLALFVRKTI